MEPISSTEIPTSPQFENLEDPWELQPPIPLDGYFERNRYSPLFMAFMALLLTIILFQVVIGPIAIFLLLLSSGMSPEDMIESLTTTIAENAQYLLTANTVGQFLGLALPIYFLSRMHSSRQWAFLRVRKTNMSFMGLSVLGLVALTPLVWWTGNLNSKLPLPEWLAALEESQMELIEQVLSQNLGLAFSIFVMAITPAICEEILFRGYIQRNAERSLGVWGGILFSGIIFGFFHLRLTQVVPLSMLGVYMAYITWRSGSLWPAILVHFVNNAAAVAMAAYFADSPDISAAELENIEVPFYGVLLGTIAFVSIIFMMKRTPLNPPSSRDS